MSLRKLLFGLWLLCGQAIGATERCDKFYCSKEESTYCMKRHNDTVMVYNHKSCSENDVCIVDSLFNGVCLLAGDAPAKYAYPGEPCASDAECPFGPKVCDLEVGICRGFDQGSKCKITADCNPEYYCYRGACIRTLGVGETCDDRSACGRAGFCHFRDPHVGLGRCIRYMSLGIGEQATHGLTSPSTGEQVCKLR